MKLKQYAETVYTIIRNLILGGNVISLSLLNKPRSMIGYVSEILFLFRTLNPKSGIRQSNVLKVFPFDSTESITLGNLKSSTWFFASASYLTDLISLCMICRSIKPKTIFEIGTFNGYTALHMALNTPADAVIHTLDLPTNEEIKPKLNTTITDDEHIVLLGKTQKYCFEKSVVASKIHCLYGDSANYDYSSYFNKVDLFFIDGAHSYEYVRSDTLNAINCCHPGSVIVWHDYGRSGLNGVSKWLLEFSGQGYEVISIPGGSLAFTIIK
ncbi:MAG: hypothetical protein A2509_04045 [Candidatus Edwardsbacteria bacterium RIFOXYD12_FULL_50_11]|uniref:Methyltransferase n=1 Tax=Candidatus Edwardsbacteria bacterium GWF2_54_11 TaxID=1817851 RepID=A0A1F5R0Y3_9BACT|nr:MAG: hypothetical protein A2502_05250 [Candidatus Edwardsbacteria bacterium RifOxyC12_full_54_24]OGF07862.1 MAG: hypothetical protein A2273_05205 [Candidatus Edwardsbacteria bacterium RifOxyA12_full_54_48]OGF08134.1 MAG: hypothetical protein A2024_08115 [Candidatus Edwardsbacteria bacterium GWF2_54_11]OGF10111.1 MAG: hypothetical protein A3K15_11620 [Candidatus Edwardsbacteria bacterium GWE2_54_12]OGF15022.1 MAG: hypothetical protein A2509_04045 [Candidatus Edwardsbacteria bacterium RIFOXYD1